MDSGVGLLCRLLAQWGRAPAGVLALAEWLLGDEDANDDDDDDEEEEAAADEASTLDEDEFLFEKGDLNLWAEPVQWVKLLHDNLSGLVRTFEQNQQHPGATGPDRTQLHSLVTQARAKALGSQQALDALPPLPQFSCSVEHTRLTLRHLRATLALDVLERLR